MPSEGKDVRLGLEVVTAKATPEMILKVAKNIALIYIFNQAQGKEAYEQRIKEGKGNEFIHSYKNILDECWKGTEQTDVEDKARFTSMAVAALIGMGYEVDDVDQVIKAILV